MRGRGGPGRQGGDPGGQAPPHLGGVEVASGQDVVAERSVGQRRPARPHVLADDRVRVPGEDLERDAGPGAGGVGEGVPGGQVGPHQLHGHLGQLGLFEDVLGQQAVGAHPAEQLVVALSPVQEPVPVGDPAVRGVAGGDDQGARRGRARRGEPYGDVEGHPAAHAVPEQDVRSLPGHRRDPGGGVRRELFPGPGELLGEPPLAPRIADGHQTGAVGQGRDPVVEGGGAPAAEGEADQSGRALPGLLQAHRGGVEDAHEASPAARACTDCACRARSARTGKR